MIVDDDDNDEECNVSGEGERYVTDDRKKKEGETKKAVYQLTSHKELMMFISFTAVWRTAAFVDVSETR